MSEKRPLSPESKPSPEANVRSTSPERRGGKENESERLKPQVETERLARKELENLHEKKEQDKPFELMSGEDKADQKVRITKDDKDRAYNHTLKHVQSKLTKSSKGFSKLIHIPAIERTSEALEKTIARPSGILGGAIFATLGLAAMSFFARRYGFALSGSELLLFVSAGWLAGLVIEFVWRKLAR